MITKVYLSDRLVIIIPSFVYQYTKNIDNLRSVLNQYIILVLLKYCRVYPSIPTTKDILLQCMDSSQCNIYRLNDSTHVWPFFRPRKRSSCTCMRNGFMTIHSPTTTRWSTVSRTTSKSRMLLLPSSTISRYLLLKKTADLPSFDERFVNYGYNYISYIETLRFTGYEFGILNNGFLISLPSTMYIRSRNGTIPLVHPSRRLGWIIEMNLRQRVQMWCIMNSSLNFIRNLMSRSFTSVIHSRTLFVFLYSLLAELFFIFCSFFEIFLRISLFILYLCFSMCSSRYCCYYDLYIWKIHFLFVVELSLFLAFFNYSFLSYRRKKNS